MAYLVAVVADRADDAHADALRELARELDGAGFFDDPAGGEERTVGAYANVEALTDELARALLGHVGELSGRLELRIEVQFDEAVLGHLVSGVPDPALTAALTP
jgi:hypothetical protein